VTAGEDIPLLSPVGSTIFFCKRTYSKRYWNRWKLLIRASKRKKKITNNSAISKVQSFHSDKRFLLSDNYYSTKDNVTIADNRINSPPCSVIFILKHMCVLLQCVDNSVTMWHLHHLSIVSFDVTHQKSHTCV